MGLHTAGYPVVRSGLFDLQGQARDSNTGDPVAYQVLVFQPGNYDAPLANVTLQPRDANGFHAGRDNSGDLGTNDFTTLANGMYDLVLIVHGGGGEAGVTNRFSLDTPLKIGQFSFSEQDLVIPASGIPLTVTRTYNSINPLSADFGYSWTYAINAMDVQLDDERQDVTIGSAYAPWADRERDANGLPLDVSIRTGGGWDVTLTLPNGRRTTFVFSVSGDQAQWTAPSDVAAGALLTVLRPGIDDIIYLSDPPFWASGDNTYGQSTFDNHDVPGWVLQTLDGTKYYITRGPVNNVVYSYDGISAGIEAQACGPPQLTLIVQRTGASTGIGPTGITNYAGSNGLTTTIQTRSVLFDRDAQGRITALYDPNSLGSGPPTPDTRPSVRYIYDQDTGNLIQVLKLVDSTAGTYTTNKYIYGNQQFPHYITEIDNANGVPVARNFYDASGRLTEVDDANGNKTQFLHSTTNQTEIVTDRLGNTNSYVYDLNGNVLITTNALGKIKTMAYDSNNNKTNEVAFLNGLPYATNTTIYDGNNLLLFSVNALGFSNTFAYDSANGYVLTNTVDALGNSSTNYYDAYGNLTGTSDALGNTTANFYDGSGLLLGSVDALGTRTTNSYDASQNLVGTQTLDASGVILSSNTFAYDANNNRTNSTVWRLVPGVSGWVAATTAYIYDAQNRVVQTINPDGGTNTVVYDPTGRQQATIDPLGRTNSYTYDVQGRLIQTTFPDASYSSSAYDANGNRTNSVDQLRRTTTYIYDVLNRLTQTVFADNTTNATVYDDVGRVQFSIDARGVTNASGYDVAGQRVAVTNAWGTPATNISFYAFDANGNQTNSTDALGHTTTNVFDALNRQVQVLYADGTKTSTAYDADGRRTASTNQDGIVTLFGYDGAGKLTSVTNALGTSNQIVTRYAYDQAGNQTNQVDALNRATSFNYDGMGRRTSRTLPGGQTETFGYDPAGNLLYHTNFNGAIITNVYDPLNRVLERVYPNGTSNAFTYTLTGQRQTMNDASGAYSYAYDLRDRLITNMAPAGALVYAYDASGNVTGIASSATNGTLITYQYDALNRLTNVIDWRLSGAQNTAYRFDPAGNLQSLQYPNGVTNLYQHDSLNRLTNLTWKLNASTIASFYYQVGSTGNRTNLNEMITGTNRTYAWRYDALYRLTNEGITGTDLSGTLGYSLDLVGNRLSRTNSLGSILASQSFNYNSNDWLNTDKYDSNGNTITNASNQPYAYDYENRLINFNSGAVLIVYDADGNRVSKTTASGTTLYLVDNRNPSGYVQVLEELTVSGGSTNLARAYTYGLSLISQRQPGVGTNFYGVDGHGSARFLLNPSGAVTDTYAYDAYGNLTASTGSTSNNYLYCCEQFDLDLGSYYLRARTYNPATGRFPTMDTDDLEDQENPFSLHKYLYCQANPVNGTDPSGQDPEADFSLDSLDARSVGGLGAEIEMLAAKITGNARPSSQEFWAQYQKVDYDVFDTQPANVRKFWSLVGGNIGYAGWNAPAKPNHDPWNSCATRISWALNRTSFAIPKDAPEVWQANDTSNYPNVGKGDGLPYIIRTAQMTKYLHRTFGTPDYTGITQMTGPTGLDAVKNKLQPTQCAVFCTSNNGAGHTGALKKNYSDPEVGKIMNSQRPVDVWILSP